MIQFDIDDAYESSPDRGVFDARYLAFLATVEELRPGLHRYCARMTGSSADGEDLVQETLFQAYRQLESYDDTRPLKPWLFRIAHNRCVDFLRRRGFREDAEAGVDLPDTVWPVDPLGPALGRAVEHLVLVLPPLERACVLLKDVLDHSLEEIAPLVGSTVGGVKAALHRGRAKLASAPRPASRPRSPTSPHVAELLREYVERFNRRDWDGLRELVAADTQVRVADRFSGRISNSPYFGHYARITTPWRMLLAEVDGEPMIVKESERDGVWAARGLIRLRLLDDHVSVIADYEHCPWVLAGADVIHLHSTQQDEPCDAR